MTDDGVRNSSSSTLKKPAAALLNGISHTNHSAEGVADRLQIVDDQKTFTSVLYQLTL